MDDAAETAIRAHAAMLKSKALRDAAIRKALTADGMTAYQLAKRFRADLGEDDALTDMGIKRIGESGDRKPRRTRRKVA